VKCLISGATARPGESVAVEWTPLILYMSRILASKLGYLCMSSNLCFIRSLFRPILWCLQAQNIQPLNYLLLGYVLDDPDSIPGRGWELFSSPPRPDQLSGTSRQWVLGALSSGVKRPEREAELSPTFTAEVKNAWSYICTPPYVFMTWFFVKPRDNFTFTFTFTFFRCFDSLFSPLFCLTWSSVFFDAGNSTIFFFLME